MSLCHSVGRPLQSHPNPRTKPTQGGEYYVDGALASDYPGLVPASVFAVVRAYAWARFKLGSPLASIPPRNL